MAELKLDGVSFKDVKFKVVPAPPGKPKPNLMSHKGTMILKWDTICNPFLVAAFMAAVRQAMRDEAERN